MKRKAGGTTFQDLNEIAKEKPGAGAGEMADLAKFQEMFAGVFNDPEAMEAMAAMGQDMQKAMNDLAEMDPEDLQKQMNEVFELMTQGSMVDSIVDKKDEVLRSLEQSGMVSAEELQKYKEDPAYFEEQMRGAFDQMQGLFSDPDVLKNAADAMIAMQQAFSDPAITELTKLLEGGLEDDDEIEEARLDLLANPDLAGNPVLASLFADEGDFQDILRDPKKWRDSVKEGQGVFKGQTAGVGEL